jgi:choline monooxygenase
MDGIEQTFDGVPLQLAPGRLMAPAAYVSRSFYDVEMTSVFPDSWVFVGHERWIEAPGDYLAELVGVEPVVVVRQHDGSLRAHSNVCPHRGSTIVEGTGNCGRRLVCPYHGWIFELDGRLTGVPRRRQFSPDIDTSELGLLEVRVDVWEGLVFVNVSGEAPPLIDYLEAVPDVLGGHRIGDMMLGVRLDDGIQANWKLVMDNAICDYHLSAVHGTSIAALVDVDGVVDRNGSTTAIAVVPWTAEALPAEPFPGLDGDAARGSLGCFVFPNLHVIGFPTGGATVMWWTPTAIDATRARVLSLSHDAEADVRSGADLLSAVQHEDFAVCEKMQVGVRSGQYRPGPRHETELRIAAFQQQLLDRVGRATRPTGGR